jgi:DNA polymerase-3 subunit epsilon
VKTVLIVDVETSGLLAGQDALLEVGVAVWSVEHSALIEACSFLVRASENAAAEMNGIPVALVRDARTVRPMVGTRLRALVDSYGLDAALAHNAAFDQQWLPELHHLPWVCTMSDVKWPSASHARNLAAVALAHGVGVVDAHRALTDVLTVARLLEAVAKRGHDVAALLAAGLRPKATFRALVSYEEREKAKQAGFGWDGATRQWTRTMAIEDAGALPFKVVRVGEEKAA